MGSMFSSSSSVPETVESCKNSCSVKYGVNLDVSKQGENPPGYKNGMGGGKGRKSTLSTFKKGRAKRKASKKQRH